MCYIGDMIWNLSDFIADPIASLTSLCIMLPIILISLTVHEWGHARAAYACGDDTAYLMGRMTLNPFHHIDWVGFLCMLFFGFGWAKPVPVNSRKFKNYRKGEAIVSLAGVMMNLVLVLIGFVALVLIGWLKLEWLLGSEYLFTILYYLIALNCTLALFNLLPIYPLDGYHIFELLFAKLLPVNVLLFLRKHGRMVLILFLLVINVTDLNLFGWLPELLLEGAFGLMQKLALL